MIKTGETQHLRCVGDQCRAVLAKLSPCHLVGTACDRAAGRVHHVGAGLCKSDSGHSPKLLQLVDICAPITKTGLESAAVIRIGGKLEQRSFELNDLVHGLLSLEFSGLFGYLLYGLAFQDLVVCLEFGLGNDVPQSSNPIISFLGTSSTQKHFACRGCKGKGVRSLLRCTAELEFTNRLGCVYLNHFVLLRDHCRVDSEVDRSQCDPT
mmetsp:Transcript_23751/g.59432  ORF Transcript_23751/g.59432 Transcript_23751/m.59432 type:complete len:209 (+) Transcript_23751:952-1578(+)